MAACHWLSLLSYCTAVFECQQDREIIIYLLFSLSDQKISNLLCARSVFSSCLLKVQINSNKKVEAKERFHSPIDTPVPHVAKYLLKYLTFWKLGGYSSVASFTFVLASWHCPFATFVVVSSWMTPGFTARKDGFAAILELLSVLVCGYWLPGTHWWDDIIVVSKRVRVRRGESPTSHLMAASVTARHPLSLIEPNLRSSEEIRRDTKKWLKFPFWNFQNCWSSKKRI